MANTKQDSNLTSLRIAKESQIGKVINGNATEWIAAEPNSYGEFGGKLKSVARKPITADRQRRKGSIVDIDTAASFNTDLTMNNLTRLLQGFFFNNIAEKQTNITLDGTTVNIAISSVVASTKTYTLASAMPQAFNANGLCFCTGFKDPKNNGFKVVVSKTTTTVVFGGLSSAFADETPPATAKITQVGAMFGSGTSAIVMNGKLVRFTDSVSDLSGYNLQVGEWVFIGGDATALQFVNNIGWARISAITAGYLEFDKVSWANPQAEVGTGLTIQIFFGSVLRNTTPAETPVRRTYQLERLVGNDSVGIMSEYVVGAVANEFTLNIPQSDKVSMDLNYIGLDLEQRNGTTGIKAGKRPTVLNEDAINTTSDITRVQLSTVNALDATPVSLFAYATNVKLTLKNNASVDKAIGHMGGFEISVGGFEVDGSLECYFADMDSVISVRNNADVTLDMILMQPNAGIVVDVPLIQLGDGSLKIEPNKSIMLPLSTAASMGANGYTLLWNKFDYLPALAGS